MRHNSLKEEFLSIVTLSANGELWGRKPLSPDFFTAGGRNESIVRTHNRLVQEAGEYAQTYGEYVQTYNAVKTANQKLNDFFAPRVLK